ncbi:hypothetical protein TRFO_22808 [Tritrichomonas foetus]|uniref:UDENN domain-containing protein n=1 Tax=Tritrichomonas foetus TaxID=1144522 RepID=A0A1J4KH03_9EUKA|nr:hypothetical protein TRFO_22808 [Tritrichomonas foetus]|eukprot:OHT08621.1 hypothetical protein TRFO_22808 [Tritrichomonas foetus]
MIDEVEVDDGDIEISPSEFATFKPTRRQSSMEMYNYDHSIHHSIKQKRLSMSFLATPIFKRMETSAQHIYEHFLIIGCPMSSDCSDEHPKPQILFCYPSAPLIFSPQEFKTIVHFCFPSEFKPIGEQDKKRLFMTQFIFRLTEASKGNAVYGVCTHVSAAACNKSFFYDERSKQYPFCFCFLTTNPMFSVIFQYETFLAMWTCQNIKFVPHPDAFLKYTPPTEEETPTLLPNLVFAAGSQRAQSIRIPRAFLQELAWFHSLQANKDSKQDVTVSSHLHLVLPKLDSYEAYIQAPSLDSLFSALSLKNIVKLYSELLLEVQTVFVSANIHKLTLSVIAAVTLLAPFNINGTLMPLLPRDSHFMALLESPVPYIAGLLVDEHEFIAPQGVCVVDLDHDLIIEQEAMPELPKFAALKHKLKTILKEHEQSITVPQKTVKTGVLKKTTKVNEKYINFLRSVSDFAKPRVMVDQIPQKYIFTAEVVNQIMDCFMKSIAPTVEALIKPCFVTETTDINNPVTVFNKELFLDSVPENARPFYSLFATTTMFQDFCDTKTDATAQEIVDETQHRFSIGRRRRTTTRHAFESNNSSTAPLE